MLFADFPNSKFWFPEFFSSYAWHVTKLISKIDKGQKFQLTWFLIFFLHSHCLSINTYSGLFPAFWEKAPGQNWEKMVDLTSKLGEINDIEHNDQLNIKIGRY